MRNVPAWLAAAVFALGFVPGAHAVTVEMLTVAELNLEDRNNDNVADGRGIPDDAFFRVFGAGGSLFRAALEFDLGQIPAGARVRNAKLRLTDYGTEDPDVTIEVHGYPGNGLIDIDDGKADNPVARFRVVAPRETQHLRTLDVTGFIQAMVAVGANYAGFMLRSANESGFNGADICSSSGDALPNYCAPLDGTRPLLAVSFDAIPAAPVLPLLLLGGGLLALRRSPAGR